MDDVDLENTSNNLKTHRMLDRSDRILDSVGIREKSPYRALENEFSKQRLLKITNDREPRDDYDIIHKWTPMQSKVGSVTISKEEVASVRSRNDDIVSVTSAAALRARQTKDRLNDIEEEMAAMSEKQAAREARVARLRALVAETEAESADFERGQARAEKASARKERAIEY